jgi:hypothetical protein
MLLRSVGYCARFVGSPISGKTGAAKLHQGFQCSHSQTGEEAPRVLAQILSASSHRFDRVRRTTLN